MRPCVEDLQLDLDWHVSEFQLVLLGILSILAQRLQMVIFCIVIEVEIVLLVTFTSLALWFLARVHLVLSLVTWSIILISHILHHQIRFLKRVSVKIVFQIHCFNCLRQLFKSIII